MSMTKHIVRTGVVSLAVAALAFAHPTDVGSPTDASEARQEQASTVAHEEEMRQEKLLHKTFRFAPRPAVRLGDDLFESVRLEP